MEAVRQQWVRSFAVCFAGWTCLALFFFSQGLLQKYLSGDPSPWWHHLIAWLTGAYIAAALTPFVLWLGRRLPFRRTNWVRIASIHLTLSLAFALLQLVVEAFLLFRFGVFPSVMKSYVTTFVFLATIGFHQDMMTYWIILGIQRAFRYYRDYQRRERDALRLELRASELKSRLTHARLSALKTQLQPHFLFNTLNAITVLVRQGKGQEAEETLARLSDLLRCVLEDVEAQEVPLRRELDYLRLYLSIEKVRFKDRLAIEVEVDPDVLDAAFPHLGLQPLVENAIRHGVGRRSAAGHIRIAAGRAGDALQVRIQDDGPGFSFELASRSAGIGLANTRARLDQLYGTQGTLTMENAPEGGAVVTVSVPFRAVPNEAALEWMEAHAFDNVDRG
jgi:two-component system LytT family sensor kinase